MRTNRACYSREPDTNSEFAETQKQTEWESFTIKKGEDILCALVGGCCHGEAGGGLTSRGHLM